jgi:hypothetical protein
VEGKRWFVFRTALTYGVTVAGATHLWHHLVYGASSIPVGKFIFFALVGIYIASDEWSTMESKYQNVLLEAQAKALPETRNPKIYT